MSIVKLFYFTRDYTAIYLVGGATGVTGAGTGATCATEGAEGVGTGFDPLVLGVMSGFPIGTQCGVPATAAAPGLVLPS